MRRFRFHLGTLVLVVLLVGVGLAALRESNENWDSGIFSLTLAVLSISVLLAIRRTDLRRAFWLGFALFGSAYLGLSLVPSIEPRLVTTKMLAYLDSKMARSIPAELTYIRWLNTLVVNNSQPIHLNVKKGTDIGADVTFVDQSNPNIKPYTIVTPPLARFSGTTENFIRIGHSLFAVVVAFLGGRLSKHLHTKNRQAA
jgi:hypothetical protein